MKRAAALEAALGPAGRGRVLWIDVEPVAELDAAQGANRGAPGSLPRGPFDAVVIGAGADPLQAVALEARGCVREGGVLALVVPVEREGLRAATQRAALMFDRRARVRPLEDACAALLEARVSRVEVIEIEGARGEVVVHGRVVHGPDEHGPDVRPR